VYFYLCFAYCVCTVVLILWTIGQVFVLCTVFLCLSDRHVAFYTLHYVSLGQLLKLNDDDDDDKQLLILCPHKLHNSFSADNMEWSCDETSD